jgi:hypothetical protein
LKNANHPSGVGKKCDVLVHFSKLHVSKKNRKKMKMIRKYDFTLRLNLDKFHVAVVDGKKASLLNVLIITKFGTSPKLQKKT